MEQTGMQVVLGADYSNLEQGFTRATAILRQFNSDVLKTTDGLKGLFSGKISFDGSGFASSMGAVTSSSNEAGKAVATMIGQVALMPAQFKDSINSALELASALSSISGKGVTANPMTGIADDANKATSSINGVASAFTAADASAQTFVTGSASLNNSLTDNVAILNNYKIQMSLLQKQMLELGSTNARTKVQFDDKRDAIAGVAAQQSILKQQIAQANTVINAQSKEMIAAEDSYKSLQNNLTLTSDAYRRLSAEDRQGAIGQGMLVNIKDLSGQLKGIDADMGNYQRNVGNYSGAVSQLGYTMTRTFHGLAELFIAPNRALLILSNDIPQLVSRFRELSVENQKVIAGGKEGASSWKLLKDAIDPVQLAIQLGITALLVYAPKLYQWAAGTKEAAEAAKALKKQQDELNQITVRANEGAANQITTIQTLNATMSNSSLSMAQRTNAYNEALKLYPSYLDGLSKDKALNGDLADIINNKLIPAILAAAQARALQDKIAKIAAENIDLEQKQAEAVNNTASAMGKLSKAKEDVNKNNVVIGGNSFGAFQTNYAQVFADDATKAAQKAIDAQEAISKKIGGNTEMINKYAKSIQDVSKQMGNLDSSGKDISTNADKQKTKLDAVSKSANNLAAALKEIDAQHSFGQLTDLEAAKKTLEAYQKDLTVLFQNGGSKVKINIDLSEIDKAQAKIKALTVANALSGVNAFQGNQDILIKLGFEDKGEALKAEISNIQAEIKKLTIENKIPIDSTDVLALLNRLKDAKTELDSFNASAKIKLAIDTSNTSKLDISKDLQNGWITPLEAANENVKRLETELKALQKAGADSSVTIPVKIDLQGAKQDALNLNALDQLGKIDNKDLSKTIVSNILIDYKIIDDKQQMQQKIQADRQQFQKQLELAITNLPLSVQSKLNIDLQGDIDLSSVKKKVLDAVKSLPDGIKEQIEKALGNSFDKIKMDGPEKKLSELFAEVNKTLNSIATDGIAALGEAIGTAFAGGNIGNIFGSFMQSLGTQLEDLGKWMIKTATEFAIFKNGFVKAMKANPILGIAAGIATVALGAAINSAFQKKQSTAFADGGLVYGTTNAIIGEYAGARSNPEVVAPLDKLKTILGNSGGNTQYIIPEVKLRSGDIYLSFKAGEKAYGR